jgi:hypothetical protein
MFRHILSSMTNFSEIVSYINSTTLGCGMYVIASGPLPRQGVIFSRSQGKNVNPIYDLRTSSTVSYLVQTNYDRWLPDPPADDRRTVAEEQLAAFNNTNDLHLFATLSTYPVQNPTTAFTCIMHAATGEMDAFIRQPIQLKE